MEISREDAKWLMTVYAPIKDYGRIDKWIDHHCQAMSIMRGTPVGRPECTCQYGATARIASSMYEQHLSQIQAAAQEPVIEEVVEQEVVKKTRGRRKTGI